MGESTRAAICAALAFATLLVTAALWKHPLALIVLLVAVGVAIFMLRPTRSSLAVYLVGFVFGPLAEILGIHAGAWRYASPSFLGIPSWLPFVWGNAALFIMNTSDFIGSWRRERRRSGRLGELAQRPPRR